MIKVKLQKGKLDHFRRLARESKLEIQAYLSGEVISPTLVVIDDFHYTKVYHTQTPGNVAWLAEDLENLKRTVEATGKRIVSDLHSHPSWDSVMSPDDYNGAITEGLRLCGICSIYNKRTRVRFWTPDCALPAEIVYK